MVTPNIGVGDRVKIANTLVRSRNGVVSGVLHHTGAQGVVINYRRGSVVVRWDTPYRYMTHSGWRRAYRFELVGVPW